MDMNKTFMNNDMNSNYLLAKYLRDNNLVLADDVVVELSREIMDSLSVQPSFDGLTRLVYTCELPQIDDVYLDLAQPLGKERYHINFISSLFNERVGLYLNNVIPDSSFNIGVCTNVDSEYIVGKLSLIDYKKRLEAKGIKVNSYEDKLEKNNHVYVLTNRGKKNGR